MAKGQRSEFDPRRSGSRDAYEARMQTDHDEAMTGPLKHRFVTPDYVKDSRALLEQERL